jgi:hypothetical protein
LIEMTLGTARTLRQPSRRRSVVIPGDANCLAA